MSLYNKHGKLMNAKLRGIIAVVLASACYGLTPTLTSIALEGGIPIELLTGIFGDNYPAWLAAVPENALSNSCVVAYTMLFGLISTFIILCIKKKLQTIRIRAKKISYIGIFGGGAYFLTLLLMSYSYMYMDKGAAVVLHSTHMIFACAIGAIAFKEYLGYKKVIAIVLSLTGIYLISSFGGISSALGPIFAIASAITYASYFLAGKYAYADIDSTVATFYINASAMIIGVLIAVISGVFALPGSLIVIISLIAKGIIGGLIAVSLMLYGIRTIGAGTSSMLSMLEPVLATLFGVLIWQEDVTISMLIGCVLIVASAIFLIHTTIKKDQAGDKAINKLP